MRLSFYALLLAGFLCSCGCLHAELLISSRPEQDAEAPSAQEPAAAQTPEEASEFGQAEETAGEGDLYEVSEVLQVEVIGLEGDVSVKVREGAYAPAEEGMLLESGATLKTGAGATVELGFDEADRNIVRIEENTTVVLLIREDEKIELLEGEVFSIIGDLPQGTAFEIRTPTAVAGARGTEWATTYKDGTTDVEAFNDVPYVKSFDEAGKALGPAVDVDPGFVTSVRRFQRPEAPQRIPELRRRHWNRVKQDLKSRVRDVRQKRGRPERDPQKIRRFKTQAGKGDPRIRQLKDRASRHRQEAGREGPGGKVPGKDRGTFKDRIERGDSWRERIRAHMTGGAPKEGPAREGRAVKDTKGLPHKTGNGPDEKGPSGGEGRQGSRAGDDKRPVRDLKGEAAASRKPDAQQPRDRVPAGGKEGVRQGVARKRPQGASRSTPLSRR